MFQRSRAIFHCFRKQHFLDRFFQSWYQWGSTYLVRSISIQYKSLRYTNDLQITYMDINTYHPPSCNQPSSHYRQKQFYPFLFQQQNKSYHLHHFCISLLLIPKLTFLWLPYNRTWSLLQFPDIPEDNLVVSKICLVRT